MMSQGHPIYTPQAAGMRYYHGSHAAGAHSVPAHEPPAAASAAVASMLHRRSHHTLPSPPPPAASSSLSPYASGPVCWSPGAAGAQAAASVNTLPPIMVLAAIAPPPGPTPAPSPTTLVHTYLGAETHAPPAPAPDAQPRAKRHKSISAGAEDQGHTPPQRRSSNKRTARSSEDTQQQMSADEAADSTGIEAARILEERRRRNANASARFRKRRNERERELVTRCLFLEHHLLQAMGPSAFEQLMRKAPAAAAIEGSVVGRRSAAATAASVDMRDLLSAPLQGADGTDDGLAATANSGRKLSVTALTAPKTMDDVWSAYLSLSQQVSTVVQRVQSLEDYSR
ncbi:hypothetical protein GGI23_003323 [Coemansia sp. RSA 2559]|nr:hypothetical protein GGI23_003323 [Coemansia sp. RSA 2559]KAJ2852932.1 hypothetical protein GGI22_005076 [Coemansia erecta]